MVAVAVMATRLQLMSHAVVPVGVAEELVPMMERSQLGRVVMGVPTAAGVEGVEGQPTVLIVVQVETVPKVLW